MSAFSTDFTGAAGTNLEDTDAGWSLLKGTAGDIELNGSGYLQTNAQGRTAGPPEAMVGREPGVDHYAVSMTFANLLFTSNIAILVAATADGANGIWLCQEQNSKQLFKVVGGSATRLEAGLGAYREAGTFTVEWDGSEVTVYDPADSVIYGPTAVSDVASAGGTYCGVTSWAESTNNQADDWEVFLLSAPGGSDADLDADLPAATASVSVSHSSADLSADLPAITGSLGAVQASAELAGSLPAATADMGAAQVDADLSAALPAVVSDLAAAQAAVTFAPALPAVTASLLSEQATTSLSADLPAVMGVFATGATAAFNVVLPAVVGVLSAAQANASLNTGLPSVTANLGSFQAGVSLDAGLPTLSGNLSASQIDASVDAVFPAVDGNLTAAQAGSSFAALLAAVTGSLTATSGDVVVTYPSVTIQALLQGDMVIGASVQEEEVIEGAMVATVPIVAYTPSMDGARRMSIENKLLSLYNAGQITLAGAVADSDGDAVDITGWSFNWKMVKAASRDAVASPADVSLSTAGGDVVITGASSGEVEVRIPTGSFDGLTGDYRWQLIGTDTQDREWVVSTGPLYLWPTL